MSLLSWMHADDSLSLWPGQRLQVVAENGDAATRLLAIARETALTDRGGRALTRPSGCRVLPVSAGYRLLSGRSVIDNLRLASAMAGDRRPVRSGTPADRRCQEALAHVQQVVDLAAARFADDLNVLQRLAAQLALAWLLPHDVLWLDRPLQALSAREREQLLALADLHHEHFPLRAQVHADVSALPAWPASATVFWG